MLPSFFGRDYEHTKTGGQQSKQEGLARGFAEGLEAGGQKGKVGGGLLGAITRLRAGKEWRTSTEIGRQ